MFGYFVFCRVRVLSLGCSGLVVSTSASDWLERLVSVLTAMLNPSNLLTYSVSLTHTVCHTVSKYCTVTKVERGSFHGDHHAWRKWGMVSPKIWCDSLCMLKLFDVKHKIWHSNQPRIGESLQGWPRPKLMGVGPNFIRYDKFCVVTKLGEREFTWVNDSPTLMAKYMYAIWQRAGIIDNIIFIMGSKKFLWLYCHAPSRGSDSVM